VIEIKTGEDLFVLVSGSQVQAFTEFYTQFFQKLLLASDKHVKDIFVAEELVQDVFLKIWENPANLHEVKSIKSYLYRSVINAAINYVNRQKNIELHHQKIVAAGADEDFSALDEENEMIVLLHQEIAKLPPQCQKIFKMNRFEHLKYKEIALALHISEKTVENHIGTALKTLRKALLDKKTNKKPGNRGDILMSLFLY
jgi:RNA polymerase sigma-70 factor (family 1)